MRYLPIILLLLAASAAADEGSTPDAESENELSNDERKLREDKLKLLAGEVFELSFRRRWRLSWHLFLQQYFAAQKLHYWHPPYEERLEDVRSWCRGAPTA